MIQIHTKRFVALLDDLSKTVEGLSKGEVLSRANPLGLKNDIALMGLTSAGKQWERVSALFDRVISEGKSVPWAQISEPMAELRRRIEEDLEEHLFFQMKPDLVSQCFVRTRVDDTTIFRVKTAAEFFDTEIIIKFPSTEYDIDEALRATLFERSTSCVFHLMRVLERGLGVLATRFNVPSSHTNWHTIIEATEKAIRNISADPNRPPDWRDQEEYFSQAAAQFMLFKAAWRNHVAHARQKYTEDEALRILDSVREFMRVLSLRLHE